MELQNSPSALLTAERKVFIKIEVGREVVVCCRGFRPALGPPHLVVLAYQNPPI